MLPEVAYRWELDLVSEPEALWPLVADTNRFDRDAGTPPVERLVDRDAELTNARCAVRQRVFGLTLQYEQEPFEWTFPDEFAVVRNYSKGPLASLGVHGRLTRTASGGTRCEYEVRARPRNQLGRLAIPVQIGMLYKRTFLRTFRRYDALAQRGTTWLHTSRRPRLAAGAQDRLAAAADNLGSGSASDRLFTFVVEGDDIALSRIRPYQLADDWHLPRREVLELFLRAAREGVVSFRWDVLCPLCGVAKASVPHLDELPRGVHCSTCNIDYEANFERSVELAFRITPAIREISSDEYCIGAPMATPHVVAQTLVPPGAEVTVQPHLEAGRHRIRGYELPGARAFSVSDADGAATFGVPLTGAWSDDEPTLVTRPRIMLSNRTDAEHLVLIERTAWNDQAVTAAEVTALQEFRDLFAHEALRPGEQISVGALTVVFTDLRSSTQLYQRIGDAVAFGHVLDHFDALRAAVGRADGTIVKTIGDAVMAVFPVPVHAVSAMLDAQNAVAAITAGGEPFHLKVGIHHGPFIAVTLNGQLDYFGTSVNMAARLEGLASGPEIVISESVRNDPEVVTLLHNTPALECEEVVATVKGFAEPITTYRLRRRAD